MSLWRERWFGNNNRYYRKLPQLESYRLIYMFLGMVMYWLEKWVKLNRLFRKFSWGKKRCENHIFGYKSMFLDFRESELTNIAEDYVACGYHLVWSRIGGTFFLGDQACLPPWLACTLSFAILKRQSIFLHTTLFLSEITGRTFRISSIGRYFATILAFIQ